ncbi:MAG: site-specific integrase [Clostridia bacterium]|nr:site-specific integrase [Clostridia bacterium]
MPRRGECIYKRKDGRWEARYVREIGPDGKKKYGSVYAESYRAVKEKQQYFLLSPIRQQHHSAQFRVTELLARWLNHVQFQVKKSTYCKYEGLCRNHIQPEIGSVPLALVSREMIERFAEKQRVGGRLRGGTLSVKTVNDILIVLGLSFDFAEEEYGLSMPKVSFLREEKKEARVLSREEQERLTAELLTDMDLFKFGALLALHTGLRIGELCALLWEDMTETYIVVNKTMQRLSKAEGKTEVIIDSPKSKTSRRIVPLPSFLFPYIERFRQSGGYVIHAPKSVHSEPRTVQQKFREITRRLGLEEVTFHTLRHTFATRCVEVGFDIKTLSEILGHADVKTTLNRYVHSSFELKQRNMEKLSLSVGQ